MSFASFAATLTSGIQEVSALLPILGTEQCEKHIGSALEGGYIYAAATPLSIFGSLGVVKNGLSILVASVSIPNPLLYLTGLPKRPNHPGQRWLGARVLANAGFAPVGTVAPLIGMDKKCYKAETRLVEILEEKHIDAPESVSVQWKSHRWNIYLIFCTLFFGTLGLAPYVHLIPETSIPLPWIYPMIRVLGSSLATISIQFLIQCRVVSLMKSRFMFMVMNRLHSNDLTTILHRYPTGFQWNESLPAEECLASLGQFLGLYGYLMNQTERAFGKMAEHIRENFNAQHATHFPNPTRHRLFIHSSWILLLVSIPATVVGYIGCFTLVSRSKRANDPLIWLGVEASLAALRILLWAWNPEFDEDTEVIIQLKLSEHPPLVTTEKDVDLIVKTDRILDLVPEHRFLEWITSYTGPLVQFNCPDNMVLYFTLSGKVEEHGWRRLFMTVFDLSQRTAFTLHESESERTLLSSDIDLMYFDATVTADTDTGEMQAQLQSEIGRDHPRRRNLAFFTRLSEYYHSLVLALDNPSPSSSAFLPWKWSFACQLTSPMSTSSHLASQLRRTPPRRTDCCLTVPSSMTHSRLYLARGYEYHLKAELLTKWGEWLCDSMQAIYINARNDSLYALADPTSTEAEWELHELDTQFVWEWLKRELALTQLSCNLEDHLHERMKAYVNKVILERASEDHLHERMKASSIDDLPVVNERPDGMGGLVQWLFAEFSVGQRKRLECERKRTSLRMEKACKSMLEQAEKEGRPYGDDTWLVSERWEQGTKFIEEKWEAIMGRASFSATMDFRVELKIESALVDSPSELEGLQGLGAKGRRSQGSSTKKLEHRGKKEYKEMNETVERIRAAQDGQLDEAYHYPDSSFQLAAAVHSRFANLGSLSQISERALAASCKAQLCKCKPHVRSIINLPQHLHSSIPANDQLLFIHPSSDVVSPVIERNYERWWNQQTTNSWPFYFSADCMDTNGRYLYNYGGTIAHIMIFIRTPVRLRLRLLHLRKGEASVWIQEGHRKLCTIRTDDIAEDHVKLQDFELYTVFSRGRHELELVVQESQSVRYGLRDIRVEFDLPS